MSARNRELMALIPASLLVTVGFAAIFIQRNEVLSNVSLTYGGIFLGLCFVAHLVIRFTLPHADPYLFPLVAVLACFGLVVIYRIDEDLARVQAQWFVIGLIAFALTIFFLRDFRVLERYRYTIAFAGLALLLLPRVPGIGQQVNGAYLGVGVGPISFQPAELGKIAIVIFLAAYLQDNRRVLVQGSRRILGVTIPPLKHLGPLLVVWGAAMFMLVFIRDLGSSLMYFGAFLALLYVATNRLSFVVIGLGLFAAGAYFFASTISHVQSRVDVWLDPFADGLYDKVGGSYQIANGMFAMADGGLFGRGLGAAALRVPDSNAPLIPAPETDMIFAVIVNDLGLVGGVGVIAIYLLIAERGFKIATLATDSFSKLLATGLTAVMALQVFVIVGGVTRVIPLTGVTLPFVSYGGSSIVANFILLALLLLISNRARTAGMNVPIYRLFLVFLVLFAVLVGFTSRWAVFGQQRLRENPKNARVRIEEQQIKRGVIRAANKEVLAGSTRLSGDRYGRRYPTGRLFALPVGFDDLRQGRQGLEKYYNDALVGRKEELIEPRRLADLRAAGRRRSADDARAARAGARVRPARGPPRRGRRARRAGRVGEGARGHAVVQPQQARGSQERLQSGHAGPVSARLDDEDRHRQRRDRQWPLRARFARERPQREGDLGYAAEQLQRSRTMGTSRSPRPSRTPSTRCGPRSASKSAATGCRSTWTGSASERTHRWTTRTSR